MLAQATGRRHTLTYMRAARADDQIVWRTSKDDFDGLRDAICETQGALG